MERTFERILFVMRWLLAPLYFGLGLILVLFCVQLFKELIHIFLSVPHHDRGGSRFWRR